MFGLGFIKGIILGLTAWAIGAIVVKKVFKSMDSKINHNLNEDVNISDQDISETETEISK